MGKNSPKIAFVYDRINKWGGAERVLQCLFELWPAATLFTSVYHPQTAAWADKYSVVPSFLQHLPGARTRHEWLPNLMPLAFESFDLNSYDIVISLTSAEAKGVITKPETLHLCYLLSPTRYLWSHHSWYLDQLPVWLRPMALLGMSSLRQWDYVAAQRPDTYLTISKVISKRCRTYYRRRVDSVIYPPVIFPPSVEIAEATETDYYLVVSRLVSYKRIDLAIKACDQLKRRLVIVGEGQQRPQLEQLAGSNVSFLDKVSEARLTQLYNQARALLFPGEEDFGMVMVEAQAAGLPVVAYNQGGAQEIIQNHTTGVFFEQQTVKSLVRAIRELETISIKPAQCRQNAQRFSQGRFRQQFKQYVEEAWQSHQKKTLA